MQPALTLRQPSKALIIAAFAAIYIIWGSTYIAIAIAIKDIPPLLMAGARFFIAGLIMYLYSRVRGESTPDTGSISRISLSGVLMLFCGTGSLAWVEQYIPTGLAAIIVATVPLWFVLFDKQGWKYNFSNKWIMAGLAIGFIGVMLLFADKKSIDFSGDKIKLFSIAILMAGTICWSIGSLYSKYKPVMASTGMKDDGSRSYVVRSRIYYRRASPPGFWRYLIRLTAGFVISHYNGIARGIYGLCMAVKRKASFYCRHLCLCEPCCSRIPWLTDP